MTLVYSNVMHIYETHFPNAKTNSSITTMIESDEQPKYKYLTNKQVKEINRKDYYHNNIKIFLTEFSLCVFNFSSYASREPISYPLMR